MKHPWYQTLIKSIGLLVVGFVGLGGILGAIDDAESQVSIEGAIVFSVIIIGGLWGVENYIKRKPLEWWGAGTNKIMVSRIKNGIRIPIFGAVLLLWVPTIKGCFKNANREELSNTCIKPFSKERKFRVLILPFSKNGTSEKGDLGVELVPMFEDIISEYELDIEFHYLDSASVGLNLEKEELNHLMYCNEANIVVYGSKWYSEDSGLGKISVQYEIDSLIPDINTSPFNGKIISKRPRSQTGLMGEVESSFFQRKLNDLRRVEQLVYWLSCLSEGGKGNYEKANLLIEKALSFDSTNVNFISLKIAGLVKLNRPNDAEFFISNILRNNSNNESFRLLNLILQIQLDKKEEVIRAYNWLKENGTNNDLLEMSHNYYYYYRIFRDKPDQVLKDLDEKIRLYPESKFWYELKLFCIPFGAKKGDVLGRKFITDFLKKDSNHIGANCSMAQILCIDNKFEEADRYVNKAIKQQGLKKVVMKERFNSSIKYDLSSLVNLKAMIYVGLGEDIKANKYLDIAIELDSSNATSWHNKGNVVGLLNKNYQKSIPFYEKAFEVDSTYNLVYYQIAQLYISENKLDSGKYYLDKYYSLGGPKNAETCLLEGHILNQNNRHEEAIEKGRLGLMYDPSNTYLNKLIGSTYLLLGKTDSSQVYLEKAISFKKDYIDLRWFTDEDDTIDLLQKLYSSYYFSGDLLKAYYTNEKLIEKDSLNEEYFRRKVFNLIHLGWYEEYLRVLDEELIIGKEDPNKVRTIVFGNLDVVSLYLCHNTLKDKDLNSLPPEKLYLLAYRANMYSCIGEEAKAMEDIKLFKAQNKYQNLKGTVFVFRALALLESKKGNKTKALSEIDKGIQILEGDNLKFELPPSENLKMKNPSMMNPVLIEFYLTRTQICLDGNDLTCAKKSLKKAKSLNPDYVRSAQYDTLIFIAEQNKK